MAVFKCKMCGGPLKINSNEFVTTCEYCGATQTITKSNDEVIVNLFNRANNLRIKNEFDKSAEIYEKIINENSKDAEAYWGLVLCKYGIEYVEDPITLKRIPTCHRTQYESILTDVDFLAVLENSTGMEKNIYQTQAEEISVLQRDILAIVENEQPFDVFICYKETDENGKRTIDSTLANDIYYQLIQEGLKVFYSAITLEDKLGQEYEPYIFSALNSAKVMLVVGTKPEYFEAVWVKNEWSRYLKMMKNDRSKLLIPCYRDMDAYDLPEEFSHLQAQDMSKIGFVNDIVRGIKKSIGKEKVKVKRIQKSSISSTDENIKQLILNDETLYMGEVFADKPHGFGKAEYKGGTIYEGEWNRGKENGKGKLIWENGDIYEGGFLDGNCHGHGRMLWCEGDDWVGEWNDDKPWNGKGVWKYDNGDIYEGEFVEGNWSGIGKYLWCEGEEWIGEFKNGEPWNGEGVWRYENGDVEEGKLKEGNLIGKAKYIWANGNIYEGEYRDGIFHGKGKYIWANGDVYEGEYREGKRTGYGKYTWKKGHIYEGEFIDGVRTGKGKTVWINGNIHEGEYRDGIFHGKGKYIWADGTIYEGEYREGKRDGYGKYTWVNGDIYEGRFIENRRFGQGKMKWHQGGEWIGRFKDGAPYEGKGIFYFNNGTVENGRWKDGKRMKFIIF